MDTVIFTIRIGDLELNELPELKKAIEKLIDKYSDKQIMIAIQSPLPGMPVFSAKK